MLGLASESSLDHQQSASRNQQSGRRDPQLREHWDAIVLGGIFLQ